MLSTRYAVHKRRDRMLRSGLKKKSLPDVSLKKYFLGYGVAPMIAARSVNEYELYSVQDCMLLSTNEDYLEQLDAYSITLNFELQTINY